MDRARLEAFRITIFHRPLVRTFCTPGAIRRAIRQTVVHEIGHCFRLEDDAIAAGRS